MFAVLVADEWPFSCSFDDSDHVLLLFFLALLSASADVAGVVHRRFLFPSALFSNSDGAFRALALSFLRVFLVTVGPGIPEISRYFLSASCRT